MNPSGGPSPPARSRGIAAGEWTFEPGTGAAAPPEVSAEIAVRAVSIAASQLVCTGSELTLWWNGIERDPQRLATGARLVAELAAGPRLAVYR